MTSTPAPEPFFNPGVDSVIAETTGEPDIGTLLKTTGPLGPLTVLLAAVANDTVLAQGRLDRAEAAHDAWHAQLDAGTPYDPSTAHRISHELVQALTFWQSRLSLTGTLATVWKETKDALSAPLVN